MSIKNIIIGAIFILWISSFYGCSKDFLNQKDTKDVTGQALFNKQEDILQTVNGIYNSFHNSDYIIKGIWYEANFLTQDFHNWGSDVFFTTYEFPTNWGAFGTFWDRSYAGISRANEALPIIEQMRGKGILANDLADRLKGEVLFLRGFLYYYLACNFGGVPLELGESAEKGYLPRSTQDETFAQIADDMKTAMQLLPWKNQLAPSDLGRATKEAAIAYLGSAQMWMKQYDDAVTTFRQLDGHVSLENNFLDIHDFNNQNIGSEDIFSIQFISQADMRSSSTNTHWLPRFCMPEEVTSTGYAYADKKLYDSFEPGDTRKAATVIGPGDVHPDPKINISDYLLVQQKFGGINTCGTIDHPWKGNDGIRSGYYAMKSWRDPNVNGGGSGPYNYSGMNLIFMRYGEVLLSMAEAIYKSNNGDKNEAWSILNDQIRHRAHLGPTSETDFSKALVKEYRHEMNDEFSLWYLLRRAGEDVKFVNDNYGIVIPEGHNIFPIPQTQIAANPNLAGHQNPGY